MDTVERFASEAVSFCEWVTSGTDTSADAARNGLLRVTRLYLAALELPPPWSEELANQPDALRIGDKEWREVYVACGRLVGYAEEQINSWDCLGALALIDSAGLKRSDFLAGDGLTKGARLIAGNPPVYAELEALLAEG